MSTELRLHGKITDEIEYFATAAGNRNAHQHFFEMSDTGLRFFAPGNELVLLPDRLRQTGTGGTFCAYMFGVDQPFSDLTKPGILNRLILLGATYNDSGQLEIKGSNKTEQTYEEIFQFGNALDNYFFFVDGLSGKKHRELQEEILKRLGKTLKRMPYINRMDDSQLATALLAHLPEQSSIYLVRLSHMKHRRFQNEFQSLYYRDRTLCGEALTAVKKLATSLNLDPQQQERIQIDVMYNHRDNYRVVDDYKKVLIECLDQQSIDRQQHARLTRLRTLALRNNIPPILLSLLDEKLQTKVHKRNDEPVYTAVARGILQDLQHRKGISQRDIIQLLHAKQQARRNYDQSFEQLLIESGQLFNKQIREGAPLSLLEDFTYLMSFFDRYDSTSTCLSKIAFMEHYQPTEAQIHSLLENRHEFNRLEAGIFKRLFIEEVLNSRYLGQYGRKKILCLQKGLEEIAAGVLTTARLLDSLHEIDEEEKLYTKVLGVTKEHIRTRYSRYGTKAEQQELMGEINNELLIRRIISKPLEPELFFSVVNTIKTEALYLRTLLPQIVANNDVALRKEFLSNSTLDHFYIEELEREYFTINELDMDQLQQLRAEAINGTKES